MLNFSEKYTVTEVLTNWEMSVRQVTNGNPKKHSLKLKQSSAEIQQVMWKWKRNTFFFN